MRSLLRFGCLRRRVERGVEPALDNDYFEPGRRYPTEGRVGRQYPDALVSYGSGAIGASDPTTTLPNERGQTIQPGLNPGQNIIIKAGRVLPETLESSGGTPVVWYNLSKTAQRIVFNNQKFFPVDSGTIPPGGTFHPGLPLPEVR